jgi:hypothetical protein
LNCGRFPDRFGSDFTPEEEEAVRAENKWADESVSELLLIRV